MDVFISVDIEGIAGVVHSEQGRRGSDDYPAARKLMAKEANAAVAGAFAGGAKRVVVNDSHGDMRNLVPEEMDERAELLIGSPKIPWGMIQGISSEFGVALFIGYHAHAGTESAILDHTYSGRSIYQCRINGEPWGELDINAAVVGSYGVPLGLVSGDDKICAQAEKRIPGITTVQVKEALGRSNAISLSPAKARALIEEKTAAVVANAGDLEPFRPAPPFDLEIDFANTVMAETASLVPGTDRIAPRTLRFQSEQFQDVARMRVLLTSLG